MSLCNVFAQFNKGFWSGAGFSLGFGLSSLANRMICGNMSFPPLFGFGFGFGPFCGGDTFYPYFTSMPQINMPDLKNTVFNTTNFNQIPANYSNISFMQMPVISIGNFDTFIHSSSSSSGSSKSSSSSNRQKNGTHIYASLTRENALIKAKADSNLEDLSNGGEGWKIGNTFTNDIPFAKKGTGKLLTKVCKEAGVTLVITSALGTKNSPHQTGNGSASHYNENNPKLDIGGGLSHSQAQELKSKLEKTGLFSRVAVENDGATSHLDIQFKDEAYETV